MTARHPDELTARLLARRCLVAYMDLDLEADEVDPRWYLEWHRRIEPLPRSFWLRPDVIWGAYEGELEAACAQAFKNRRGGA